MIKIGTTSIDKFYFGTTKIEKAYFGNVLVYQSGPPVINPYITNGLVVYLDGEWNNGLGKHKSSTDTWKDLSGNGNDASGNKAITFTNNYANLISGSSFSVNNLSISGAKTIELVISFPNRNQTYTYCGQWGKGDYFIGMSNYTGFVRKSDHSSPLFNTAYYGSSVNEIVHGCLRFSSSGVELLGNLSIARSSTSTDYGSLLYFDLNRKRDSNTRSAPCHVYALRIYNRALTDGELQSNYEIDSERFGIGS